MSCGTEVGEQQQNTRKWPMSSLVMQDSSHSGLGLFISLQPTQAAHVQYMYMRDHSAT
jgi:hypothetical protein